MSHVRTTLWLVLSVVLLAGSAARGEDRDELVLRLYPVDSLVLGRWHYVREHAPPVWAHEVADEERPLFGAVGEEPLLPLGMIDEVVELVRGAVEPRFWEEVEGADVRPLGETILVVRATPAVHAALEAWLASTQAAIGAQVTVELRAVRATAEEARQALAGGDGLGPRLTELLQRPDGAGVTLTCLAGQQAAAFVGKEAAHLVEADVEVAQEATTTDPWVVVSNLGLMMQVTPLPSGDDHVLVGFDAALARLRDPRSLLTARNGRLEAPLFDVVRIRPVLRVRAGEWTVAEGRQAEADGAWWLFLVRATPHGYETTQGHAATVDLGGALRRAEGPYVLQRFDVSDLNAAVRSVRGRAVDLMPSVYAPPEPPELVEPMPALPSDALVDLAFEADEGDVWEDPALLEVRGGTLYARNGPDVLARLGRRITTLRESLLWSVALGAEIVELPEAVGLRLAALGVLDAAAEGQLEALQRAGEARTLEGLRLTSMRGRRNTVSVGQDVAYLQDYEVEIAQAAAIGNPVIQYAFDGAQLDVAAGRTPDGGAVELQVEFVRTNLHRPIRTATTEHGEIELPELDLVRLRTGLIVPLDRRAVLGSWVTEGRRRLLLLTPRLEARTAR